jgi:hypothetical protein
VQVNRAGVKRKHSKVIEDMLPASPAPQAQPAATQTKTGQLVATSDDGIDDETILLLPDGDSIAACEIEKNLLNTLPCISHALVFGSKRAILAAFLVLKSSDNSDPNLPLSPEGLSLAKQFNSSATTCR